MRARGFTLVELVMVIMITGILAASLTVFLKPAIDSYIDTRRRADLTDMADTALRRMSQDIRSAVPNSVRYGVPAQTCIQLVPTLAGGRYRMEQDTVWNLANPTNLSASLDVTRAPSNWPIPSTFDVLSPLPDPTKLVAGDWVVIGNQNTADVYSSTNYNRAAISSSPIAPPNSSLGAHRVVLGANPSTNFPSGYDGGRFVVVPNNLGKQTVFYSCVGNKLYRTPAAFDADQAATCALTNGAVVATDVVCGVPNTYFVYDPNKGATQQSGFVWMRVELSRSGESVTLAHGVHVDNVP
jgi:MSHA biogenesis protein MshO